MRIARFDLLAYGHLRELSLQLDPRTLNVVYGPNEAGKSTALRALTSLLYGIPERTDDAHTHGAKLRVGAQLVDASGATHDIVRRKGRKGTLLDAAGEPIAEEVLTRMLGGVSEPVFRGVFGLDHVGLREGAKALLEGEGDLGESLFDAAGGTRGVHLVLRELRAKAEALFTPRGRTKDLNAAIARYREALKRARNDALRPEVWLEQEKSLAAERDKERALRERKRVAMQERHQLQRALRLLPTLARLQAARAEREALGFVLRLEPDAASQRTECERTLREFEIRAPDLRRGIERLQSRIDELDVPEALVAIDEDKVRALGNRLASQRKAASDLPKRRGEMAQLEATALEQLRALGRTASLAELAKLRVPEVVRSRVRALAREQVKIETARDETERQVEAERAKLEGDVERVRTDLDALRREGDVPTEAELAAARDARDAAWLRVRPDGKGTRSDDGALDAYEASVRAADEVADRLRRETGRVTQLARLQAEAASNERKLEALGANARGPSKHDQAWARWREAWAERMGELGLGPSTSADEAERWLAAVEQLAVVADRIDGLGRRIDAMEADRVKLERDVNRWMDQNLFELGGESGLEAAEALVARHQRARAALAERRRCEVDLAGTQKELATLEQKRSVADATMAALMKDAGVEDRGALREAEERAAKAAELDRAVQQAEAELIESGEGASVEAIAAELSDVRAADVRVRLEETAAEIEQLDEAIQAANIRVGSLERGLEGAEDRALAADAAAEAAAEAATIGRLAERYGRLRLAADVLDREVKRHRDRQQGPVLERATPLFARLTLDEYVKLEADYVGEQPTLACVHRSGSHIGVAALSEGARDQLYLALRLATLACYAERAEPMPLVLDDVLMTFDDERARAALQVLADFAATTQVLLFTHHAHLVDIARDALPEAAFTELRLGTPRTAPEREAGAALR